eukprot:1349340-Amphidinium_carterae.2
MHTSRIIRKAFDDQKRTHEPLLVRSQHELVALIKKVVSSLEPSNPSCGEIGVVRLFGVAPLSPLPTLVAFLPKWMDCVTWGLILSRCKKWASLRRTPLPRSDSLGFVVTLCHWGRVPRLTRMSWGIVP